ncbi:HAD family hydrolase [Thermosyntropha sp.]|uniref:HAD family hydrolase n=1 Tax=Thermosyntropha sp. TaxID=2740820 RepID=UPI0025E74E85|nr:HAD family hydrolase [Thermosyntropha sp.]MBO8158199.1 HAD family hydrolase [Thermosyntropha sp.]
MLRYKNILFDLDGTLTDPKVGITKSVQYALNKMGIKEDDLDKLTKFIGPPLAHSFMEFYNFNEKEAYQAVEFYREYFACRGMYENQVYEGIRGLLDKLCRKGGRLIVATSKPTVFARKILEHFNLIHYFADVIGSNLDGTRVDKGEVLKEALRVMDIKDLEKTVMIGDRKHDVIGAHRNNIKAIGVIYGYGGREELEKAGADYVVSTVKELENLLI